MERIKRHQQACLREKRKGLNIIGVSDQSPSQSLSFVRDNPFKSVQVGPTFFKILMCPVKKKKKKCKIVLFPKSPDPVGVCLRLLV